MNKRLLILILICLPLSALVVVPFFVKIDRFDCSSQYGPCSNDIQNSLESLSGKSIFNVKRKLKETLKNNFEVEKIGSQYKIPTTLKVSIVIKKPTFAIKSNLEEKISLVGESGEVLAQTDSTSLPTVLTGSDLPQPGSQVDDQSLLALKLIRGVYQMFQVTSGRFDNTSLIVDIPGSVRVIFPLDSGQDPDVLLGSLRLIETKLESEYQGKFHEVDMRYKNPVLR